jgi:predicted transcriptional regulator of viral defense system
VTDIAPRSSWTFVTNHAQVLLCIDKDAGVRMRDVAAAVGITERATQNIVADLAGEGYLSRIREGRRNRYIVHHDAPLRPNDPGSLTVGSLLELLRVEPQEARHRTATLRSVPAGR